MTFETETTTAASNRFVYSGRDDEDYPYTTRTDKGKPAKTIDNLVIFFRTHAKTSGKIRRNVFQNQIEFDGQMLDEPILLNLTRLVEARGSFGTIEKNKVYDALSSLAEDQKYDPIIDKLEALKWDGTPRLTTWLSEVLKRDNTPLLEQIGSTMVRYAIRRQIYPGAEAPYCYTFIGGQGVGKTLFPATLFKPLAPEGSEFGQEIIRKIDGGIGDKDTQMKSEAAIAVLFDEGAAVKKADMEKVKTYITDNEDVYRVPYERTIRIAPRRFILFMTDNKRQILTDTENRRFPILELTEAYDWVRLGELAPQLLAEAYQIQKNGTKEERAIKMIDAKLLNESQEDFIDYDSWHNKVEEHLSSFHEYRTGDKSFFITTEDIFLNCIATNSTSIEKFGRMERNRISAILTRLGFKNKRREHDGSRTLGYSMSPQLVEKNISKDWGNAGEAINKF